MDCWTALWKLHADAAAQNAWLMSFFAGERGVIVDELALQFEDAWAGGRIVYAKSLPPAVRVNLDALDRALNAMSGADNADLWTPEALDSRSEWVRIRALALTALAALRHAE